MSNELRDDLRTLTRETQKIWDGNAIFWDQKMGEGNAFHRELVGPSAERLLAIRPGERVLDVACGNGQFSRRLAQLGAQVLACDFSATFIERARARTIEHGEHIEYRVVDAADRDQLLALGVGRFDAAVCNMGIMDMTTIDPLLQSLRELLKPGGRFVFTVMHPCFNTNGSRLTVEEEDRDGELVTTYAVKVVEYLKLAPARGLGILGQPAPHYYFHRPLHVLLASCFSSGFVVDGLEEPAFAHDIDAVRPLNWSNFTSIPPVLAVRLRLLSE